MSSLSGYSERPERSRNAKAQARHRAKRKAYIDQLEQTVTKLQTQLNITPEQIAVLPPPLIKIRELEQENARLVKENEDLRRVLQDNGIGARLPPFDSARRHDARSDFKRRRGDTDDMYMVRSDPTSLALPEIRPPPLTIPHSQYQSSGSGSGMYSMASTPFIPNTPSGSSSTSSPPFSPTQHSHSPRVAISSQSSLSASGSSSQYGSVKVEEDGYPQQQQYSTTSSYTYPNNGIDNWHPYSSQRPPSHR